MSKVTGTALGGGLITLDKQYNRRYFSKEIGNVTKKRTLFRRGDKSTLPTYSYLTQCADVWNLFSQGEKDAWDAAGLICGLTGYNLFIQDETWRLINEIAGEATPNIYHQYLVGKLSIPLGAGHFFLKKVGNEVLTFPAELNIDRRAVLTTDNGGGEYIKVRFSYVYDDGGGEETQNDELTLALSSSWGNEVMNITQNTNPTGVWALEIEGDKVKGDFYFDNLYVSDDAGIITNDPYCEKVGSKYHGVIVPNGVTSFSVYPED